MMLAGKIDGLFDLLMLLWVSARGLKIMGVDGLVILGLAGAALALLAWYFIARARSA